MTRTLGRPPGHVWGRTWGWVYPQPLAESSLNVSHHGGRRTATKVEGGTGDARPGPPSGIQPALHLPSQPPRKGAGRRHWTAGQEGESEGGRLGREGRAQWPLWGVADGPDAISWHERGPRMCILLERGQGCVLGAGRWGKALRKT